LLCRDCGFVPLCPSCGLAYSHHADIDRLVCHECGRTRGMYGECPECHGARLRGVGLGTQRLEEETALTFPEARILRWDRDVTRGRGSHERILAQFLQRQADILIGTQMIAKGLDLPYVTLVGVVAADIGLHVPDFRSAERTFQVLSQVAGRAGRGPLGGRVIIQSYAPDHYAIEAAARHDYHAMYAEEMGWRRELGYPPFGRLAQLAYTGRGERRSLDDAARIAARLTEEVRRRGEPGAWVRGPAPAFIPRRRGAFRWNIILRAPDPADILRDFTLGEGWEVDIDPVSLA
jgi:primosomal protein N' (replication factor Y)